MGPFPKMVNSVNLKSFTILVKRSRFTARKITFSFPRRLKKMLFPKKRLSCIIGKDVLSEKIIFLFPENMILPLRRKWEMIFLKRSFSSNILKRWSFQKGLRWDMIFLVLSGRMVFFSRKHDIFFLDGKWEVILLKKYTEIWYFLCTRTGATNVTPHSPASKNQRWSYLAKVHLKVIGILDWHSRKGSSNSLYFHGDLYRRFLLLSCIKTPKKQET